MGCWDDDDDDDDLSKGSRGIMDLFVQQQT